MTSATPPAPDGPDPAGLDNGPGATLTPGFRGRARPEGVTLPPGQYAEEGFPVLSAGPTPNVSTETWSFTVTNEAGKSDTATMTVKVNDAGRKKIYVSNDGSDNNDISVTISTSALSGRPRRMR